MEALIGIGIGIVIVVCLLPYMSLWRLNEIANSVEEICEQLKKIAKKENENERHN